jgi:hypothetical protein
MLPLHSTHESPDDWWAHQASWSLIICRLELLS